MPSSGSTTPSASASIGNTPIETLIASLLDAGIASLRAAASRMLDPATRRDPEIVHQARVSVRRMRAALQVFGKLLAPRAAAVHLRRAEKALRRIGRALGDARDWDVITLSLLPAQTAGLARVAGEAAVLRVRRRAQLARARANTAARRYVAADEFETRLGRLVDLRRALADSIGAVDPAAVRRALGRQSAAVLRLGDRLAQLDRKQRHRLRIEAKRLRYAVEFCAPPYPERGRKQWLNALKGLQEVLGAITDARVLADRVGPLDDEHLIARRLEGFARESVRRQLPQAAALFMAWRLARVPWKE